MGPSGLGFGQKGALLSIRLRNFMTYTDCTLTPGGGLNMIIGPNGSGKSAIVCAIIVGLAGEVSLTGRATNIVSLVRSGSDWGSTWIELWSGDPRKKNYTIERKIIITSRAEGKIEQRSEWSLNGNSATMRDIRNLTKELNIKVDNLCQFLPQDSVASFVKMSHGELLVNTLKAAGDNQLVEDLDKLTDLTKDITEQTHVLDQLEKSSKENEVNARRLEQEVERLREREQLADEKKMCSKKVVYVRYTEANNRLREAKDQIRDKELELRDAESSGDPYKQDIEVNKAEEARLSDYIGKCNSDRRTASSKISDLKTKLKDFDIKCQEAYAEYKAKEDDENTRASKLQLKKQELDGYECRYNELRTIDHTQKIAELKNLADRLKDDMVAKRNNMNRIESRQSAQISRIEAARRDREEILRIKDKKLNLIQTKRPDLHRVIDWLGTHQDKFRERVFLPMLCEINVIEGVDSAVVEHAIPDSDRWSFVCQNEHDLKYLTRAAKQELSVNINVILTPDRTAADFEREMESAPNFPRQHFRAYMKDLIDAPEPILRILYGTHNLHLLPVFTNETTEAEIKILMSRLKKFYVRENFYQISTSKYDGETMIVTDVVRGAHDLIYSLDTKKLDEKSRILESLSKEKAMLEAEMAKTSKEYDEINSEWRTTIKQHSDLNVKQDEKRRVELLMNKARKAIDELQAIKIDIAEERRKLKSSITEINLKTVQQLEKLGSMIRLFVESIERICLNELMRQLARKNQRIAKERYDQAMVDAKRLRESIEQLKSQLGRMRADVNETRQAAEEKIPGFRDGKLDKPTQKKFSKIMQQTAEQLELRIEELKARILGICRDPTNSIISDYNRQTEELRDKQTRIIALRNNLSTLTTTLEATKASFIPALNNVIKDIDDHYREFMRKLNYDGKVELEFDPTRPNDFSEYGIRILVKYRDDEKLIALSSTRQSGGERSVATMIYMLALQTQTTVPFRVVDEINQGMDKDNERKVFELLVQTAEESSSQYFLVSPKLLSGLDYGDKMQIHVVFNGPKLDFSFNDMIA